MATKMKVVDSVPKQPPGSARWAAPWDEVTAFCDEVFTQDGPEKWVEVKTDVSPSLVTHLRKGRNKAVDPDVYEVSLVVTSYEPKRGTLYMRRKS
jgi:hypothetical protein